MNQFQIKFKQAIAIKAMLVMLLSSSMIMAQPVTKNSAAKKTSVTENITMTKEKQQAITPQQALQNLKDGNNRFVSGKPLMRNMPEQTAITAKGQYPYAVILGCVDSRASAELIFDAGLGDFFSARIAGNFVNTDILGSMEFACKVAGAKMIVVMGHSKCGAIKGACDNVELGNLTHLISEIKPSVESVKNIEGERNSKNDTFVQAVATENVKLAIKEIQEKSPILAEMEKKGEIIIVGAMQDLDTGKVDFIQD